MKIELITIVANEQEVSWLDYGLESILDKTKHEIHPYLFVAKANPKIITKSAAVCEKYNVQFEPHGDNFPIGYVNEGKVIGFEQNKSDCVMSLHPDVVFTKKDVFDDVLNEASEYFDSKYAVYVSSDHPDDVQPMGITIHTRLGWEKIGCEDINFYPQAGVEHDYHRRAYLEWGLDPNDLEKYWAPIHGIETPEWVHRIRCPECLHLEKSWNSDPRLVREKLINLPNAIFHENIVRDTHIPYYRVKWGGTAGAERFLKPFNREEYTNRIGPENWTNPYPEIGLQPLLKGITL